MTKAVLDTSVFIAGLLTKKNASSSAQVLSLWKAGKFLFVFSPQILEELVAKLIDKGFPEANIKALVKVIWEIGLYIPGSYEVAMLDKTDPDDNKLLAAALESKADYLVTLDKKHLLPLKHYHGTRIVTPALFVRALLNGGSGDPVRGAVAVANDNRSKDRLTRLTE